MKGFLSCPLIMLHFWQASRNDIRWTLFPGLVLIGVRNVMLLLSQEWAAFWKPFSSIFHLFVFLLVKDDAKSDLFVCLFFVGSCFFWIDAAERGRRKESVIHLNQLPGAVAVETSGDWWKSNRSLLVQTQMFKWVYTCSYRYTADTFFFLLAAPLPGRTHLAGICLIFLLLAPPSLKLSYFSKSARPQLALWHPCFYFHHPGHSQWRRQHLAQPKIPTINFQTISYITDFFFFFGKQRESLLPYEIMN